MEIMATEWHTVPEDFDLDRDMVRSVRFVRIRHGPKRWEVRIERSGPSTPSHLASEVVTCDVLEGQSRAEALRAILASVGPPVDDLSVGTLAGRICAHAESLQWR